MVVLGVAAFISCQKDMITPPVAQQLETQRITCDPLFFGSLNELQQAINNWSGTQTKGAGTFTSYANTVMQQEGYGDEPWALASSAFGSILNPDGEVLFEDKILKLGKQGILIGPASQTEEIRFLNTGYYSNVSGSYYIMTMWASGRSFMGNEIRGSGVVYTYDYD
jgi:hypothetical protein